jgi:hypothetical protein
VLRVDVAAKAQCGGERTPATVIAALPPAGVDHESPQEMLADLGDCGLLVHANLLMRSTPTRQAAQATLYSSAQPRPSSIVIELEKAIAQVRASPGKSVWLSRRAWVLVGGDPENEERVLHRGGGA